MFNMLLLRHGHINLSPGSVIVNNLVETRRATNVPISDDFSVELFKPDRLQRTIAYTYLSYTVQLYMEPLL